MEYFNDIRNQIVSWAISIKRSKWLYVLIGFPLLISFVWFFSPLFAWPTQMRMSLYTVQRIYFKEIIIIFFAMSFFIQVILIDSLIGWMCAIKCFEHRQITIELWITHTHNPYTKDSKWTVQHQLTYIELCFNDIFPLFHNIILFVLIFLGCWWNICLFMNSGLEYICTWWSFVQFNWTTTSSSNINVIIMDFGETERWNSFNYKPPKKPHTTRK